MAFQKKIQKRTKRRVMRVRAGLKKGTLPRISIFRSLNHIYGQVIDDNNHQTVASCSTLDLDLASANKKEQAKQVGLELARRMISLGIQAAILDRGGFLYHGRIEALVEGLREGGLRI